MDKSVVWKELKKHSQVDLYKALGFYQQSPDGQYDNIAALCILAVIAQRALPGSAPGGPTNL